MVRLSFLGRPRFPVSSGGSRGLIRSHCSFVYSYRFMPLASHNLLYCATFIFQTSPSRYGFLFRRICSSHPGDGEQRGQSLAALTARGRGLDCFQPQPRLPVLRQNKLRIFRFRASAKAQSLRLFLLSPRSRLLRGDPIYGRTLCVQTDWAA